MRKHEILKTAVIAYATFAMLFILCIDVGHAFNMSAASGADHTGATTASCSAPDQPCESFVSPHLELLPSNLLTFVFLGVIALAVIAILDSRRLRDTARRVHVRLHKWRDWGGGLRLYNFFQTLFSNGLLSPKIFVRAII